MLQKWTFPHRVSHSSFFKLNLLLRSNGELDYEVDVHNTPLDPTVLSRVERFLDAEIAPRVANGIEARILALRMALDDEIREALPSIIRQSIQDSFQDIQHQILNILNTVPPVGSLGSQNPSHDNNNFFQQRQNDLPTFMPHYEKTQYNHSTRLPPAGTGMSFGATNENSFATDQNIGIALSLGLPAPFTLSEAHESATCTNAIQEEQSAGYNQDWTKKINWTAQDQYSIDMVSEPFHNNQEPNHELDHDGNTHESKDAPLHPTFDPGIIVHDLNYFSQPFSIPEFTVHPDGLPSGTLAAKPKVLASFGSAQDEMRSIGSPATIN